MSTSTRRERLRQRREVTHAQILAAAREELAEVPYRELSVEAIMRRTGHTRTVFYRHFEDLPELILELGREIVGTTGPIAAAWAESAPAPSTEDRIRPLVEFRAEHGRLLGAIREAAHDDERIEKAYSQYIESFRMLAEQAINQVRETGDALEPVDPPELARALILMTDAYLHDVFGSGTPAVEPERAVKVLANVWRRAIRGG
jgi:AcrR family transcriptional regulator